MLELELVVVVERVAEIAIAIAMAEFAWSFPTYRSREEAFERLRTPKTSDVVREEHQRELPKMNQTILQHSLQIN